MLFEWTGFVQSWAITGGAYGSKRIWNLLSTHFFWPAQTMGYVYRNRNRSLPGQESHTKSFGQADLIRYSPKSKTSNSITYRLTTFSH